MNSYKLFDYIGSINNKTVLEDPDFKDYVPFVVNRALAQHKGTILYAQDMNCLPSLSSEFHYKYCYNIIPKAKRFASWSKREEYDNTVKNISSYFNVSLELALEYRNVLTQENIDKLNNNYNNEKEKTDRNNRK